MWNKWKNRFSEMKVDVGISSHLKREEQQDTYLRQKLIHYPIPISLFFLICIILYSYLMFVVEDIVCMQDYYVYTNKEDVYRVGL